MKKKSPQPFLHHRQIRSVACSLGTAIFLGVVVPANSQTPNAESEAIIVVEQEDRQSSRTDIIQDPHARSDIYLNVNPRHQACLQGIEEDLQTGRVAADKWMRDGGGAHATHCLAMADFAAGFPKLAAVRLQTLAEKMATERHGENTLTRARLFAQAAEIWLSADRTDAALNALDAAKTLTPEAGELYLLSGKISVKRRRWQDVVYAITLAEKQGIVTATGYTARARAYKELTQFDLSAEDTARALRIDPFNLKALVLRGELAQAGITINTNFKKLDAPTPTTTAHDQKNEALNQSSKDQDGAALNALNNDPNFNQPNFKADNPLVIPPDLK